MPPYASYSSVLDGSLRLESSSTNSQRYGNGSLIVQNGCEFYGSDDQYLKSSHASADLYIQSAKNLLASASSVSITGTTSAALVSTSGNVTARGTSADLIATTGSVSVVGVSSANLSSTAGSVLVGGATSVTVTSTTGPASLNATAGDTTVQASGTVYLTGASKQESFSSTSAVSTSDYYIKSVSGNATLLAEASESRVYGKTLAHLRGTDAVKVESTAGDIKLIGYTSVDSTAPVISSTATTSVSLGAPTINVVASTLSTVEAPTVEVGKTSNVVTISQLGKATNVKGDLTVDGTTTSTGDVSMLGNCSINGNLTVTGSTTNISTQNLLVQDNIIVLNSASAAGKDAGLLFTRPSGADSTSLYWDESENTFALASTKSTQDSPTVVKEAYSALRCSSITADSVTLVNFGTKQFTLDGQSSTPVTVSGINKLRGTYEFQIQSDALDGSVYNYKMVKATATATSASFGVHAAADDGSQVWVKWDAGEMPKFYMKTFSSNAGNLNFSVVFTTV